MKHINYYTIYSEHRLAVVRIQSEKFTYQDAIQINHEYKSDVRYSDIHYLLVIFSDKLSPDFDVKDLAKLSEIYNTEIYPNNHKAIVWLVSGPINTAFMQLFVTRTRDNSLFCSSLEAAYKLLNIPVEYEEFIQLIKKSE